MAPQTTNEPKSLDEIDAEIARCYASPIYFTWHYCRIKDEQSGKNEPFEMWPAQVDALRLIASSVLTIMLKARQIGMTTLVIAYAVWLAIFKPGSTVLLFSKGLKEAKDLLKRIRTVILALPPWLRPVGFNVDQAQELELTNGSRFISFSSTASGGDSFTASLVIIDEADLIKNLDLLLSGAKPTIDAGGKLIMLSRTEKANPNSSFKRIYRSAMAGDSEYKQIFFPWYARPGRNRQWYERQRLEVEQRTGALDDLYANYPATPEEALAPRELDKRFPIRWLQQCFQPQPTISLVGTPFAGWKRLELYRRPEAGEQFVIGVDVAAGNPNSDDSVITVMNKLAVEEVACLAGKVEPGVLAWHAAELAKWFNNAPVLIERNNHGHTCLKEIKQYPCLVLKGHDGNPGWWTYPLGKSLLYDQVAEVVRQPNGCIIRSQATLDQLASLDVADLSAPEGFMDDRAMSFALCIQAATRPIKRGGVIIVTTEPQAKANAEATRSSDGEPVGVRRIASYNTWEAFLERNGERVSLGWEYVERAHAATAVNIACETVGLDVPNNVAALDPPVHDHIKRQVVEALRKAGVA